MNETNCLNCPIVNHCFDDINDATKNQALSQCPLIEAININHSHSIYNN